MLAAGVIVPGGSGRHLQDEAGRSQRPMVVKAGAADSLLSLKSAIPASNNLSCEDSDFFPFFHHDRWSLPFYAFQIQSSENYTLIQV